MYKKVVEKNPSSLQYVPDHLKTQGMCGKAIEVDTYTLKFVPDHLKTEEMCEKVAEERSYLLQYVPNCLKMEETCEKAVRDDPSSLQFVPHYFVTQQQLKIWHDYDACYYDDKLIEWYDGYQKRKAQKAMIKEELLPIVWYRSRWWDWCISEDEKKETEKLWA